jgi:hypothetical protein
MHDIGADEYQFGSITCPSNYPINLAAQDRAMYRSSAREINASDLNYHVREVDNTNWVQRTNRYIVTGAGQSSLSIGVTGNWSSDGGGHHNLDPWGITVVCHSNGEFGP